MAGGKETPRQKLIGMMYLVLLALLALQIGAEIMVKFLQLNNSLQAFTEDSRGKSEGLIATIKTKVAERGNKENEVKALNEADKLHKLSKDLIDHIEVLKDKMIKDSGGMLEDNVTPAGMKDGNIAGEMFLGDSKGTPMGKELETKLDTYIDELNKIYNEVQEATGGTLSKDDKAGHHYKSLTLDGKEDPNFMKNPEQRNKKFLELAFDHTPMIASLAFLTEKQSKAAAYEAEILEKLKGMVGASDFKFDKIQPMVTADAKVVAAGTKYKAQLFVTATSSANKDEEAKMMMNGKPIKVENGMGQIEFKASYAGKPDKEGLVRKTYKGKIEMRDPTGELKTFEETFEYFVSKPVIQIQSASVSALYKNCGNELSVQVPALGSLYNPSFKVTGAQMRKGKKKGEIIVIPNAPSVALTVSSGGQTIGTEKFKVRLVPKPDIIATYRGKEVDQKRGMKAPGPRSITMKAIPDESFKAFLPKDARYRVTSWEAILVRGKRPVSTKKMSGPEGNLSSFAAQAKPGDRILIEVKEVQRKTYTGGSEKVKLGTIIMNVPLND